MRKFYRRYDYTTLKIQGFQYINTDVYVRNLNFYSDYMFNGINNMTEIDLSNFHSEKITSMSYMFNECESLTNINLSTFNTENVTNMSFMFYGCKSLTNINLANFNTKNVIIKLNNLI